MSKQQRTRRGSRLSPLEALETRSLMTIAATAPLPAVSTPVGTPVAAVDLDSYFKDANATPNSFAMVNTSLGTIPVLLTPQIAPATVANFLSYASKGTYDNTVVHRSVPGFIWQTGGFQLSASGTPTQAATDAPVKNEFGASNLRGTIAMAKTGGNPNSATDQFFFNESDSNAANLDNQNGGFTVFGHVAGSNGLAVMDAVANINVPSPGPLASPFDAIPLLNYTSGQPVQPSNYVLVKSVTTASEAFSADSDAPTVATAAISGNHLAINPLAAGTAHVTVTAYGSDGIGTTQTFTVLVTGAGTTATPTPTATNPAASTPTPTPTPTTTPTSTTTTATPTAPAMPSALLPLASHGTLPVSVVAGRKVAIRQTVTLQDLYYAVNRTEKVALSLSRSTTGTPGDYVIASSARNLKLKLGQQTKVTLSARQIKATVPPGTYHVLVTVTDPNGSSSVSDTGRTLNVLAPNTPKSSIPWTSTGRRPT